MKAGILAIGTELLMGQTVNTNATYLSRELNELGIGVYYHYTIGDNPQRIKTALVELLEQCDVVFTTGGLGPTLDDITKEIIAEALGKEMILDDRSYEIIKERFRLFNRTMPEGNIRQAYFPEGALILDNAQGTAPACIVEIEAKPERDEKVIIVLPGPPRELKHIYQTHILDYLKAKTNTSMFSKYLSVYDYGESAVEAVLMDLIEHQTNPTIATYAGDGKVLLRITSSGLAAEENQRAVEDVVKEVYSRIGAYIVSDEGKDVDQVVLDMLRDKGLKISIAESCTGGKIISELIKYAGASDVVDSGYITYSNDAKMRDLNVKPETIKVYGAVSHQTCYEMVKGVLDRSQVDIAVGITGVAGPTGGTAEKPVGLVYIGIGIKGEIYTFESKFTGDREMIQKRAVNKTFKLIYDQLIQMD